MSKAGIFRLSLFAVFLLAVSAVPVLADEPAVPETSEIELAPPSLQAQASWLPDAVDVREGIGQVEREEAAREQELEGPQATREREESSDSFADVDAGEARGLLQALFSDQLDRLDLDPARVLGEADSARLIGDTAAVVTEDGDGSLLDAGIPLQAENEAGELSKVDLSLEEAANGVETANALSDVRIGETAAEPIEVGSEGISITQLGADAGSPTQPYGEQGAFNFETLPDTDALIAPTAAGVEIFNLIRSKESPETFSFQIGMPPGAELRSNGNGGAEVVQDDEVLASIPFPTAVDAQGSDVPVEFSIEGNVINLHVAHREGEYAMPILLDPQVLEDWVNSYSSWQNGHNLSALENGSWQWSSSPYGLIYFGTGNPCFYTCWGRGLYLTAPKGTYGANTYSHWAYRAPNANSYIAKAWLIPFWRDDHGCNRVQYPQPHDYDGFWGNNDWNLLQTNEAAEVGSVAIQSHGQAFIVGLSSGGGINIPCWRDVYVGGAAIWLDDEDQPVLTTSSTAQWMDSTPVRLNVRATDLGLGVRKFEAEATDKSGAFQKWETWHPCIGTYVSRCPETWNLNDGGQPQLAYDPSVLPEGIVTLNVTAFDATLRKSTTTKGMTLRIDHAAPTIKLSGTITEQATLGTDKKKYTVRVDASDGVPNDPNPANARSGVVSISEWVDGKKVNEYAPGCSTQSCSYFDEGAIEAAAYANGKHTLVVKATDALGHVASQQLEFTLGDVQAPTLNVTGFPTESSTMPARPIFWKTFGANGSGTGQLKSPADVAIDAQGDVWVADKGNNRVQKFSATGQFLAKFGSTGTGNGQFSSPAAIAIDPKGNIWVADKGNGRVQKFNAKGEYLAQFGSKGTGNGQFASGGPEGIAIDPKGNIWVSDTYAGRIQKFDENGTFLKVVGSAGTGPGQLGEPTGIDIGPGGKVWVADWENHRVSVFSEAGEFVKQFGSEGSGNGQFSYPDAIAVGGKGDVWVGDLNNNRIQQFDQNGTYLGQFGSPGSGPGQFSFSYPMGVATDSKGSVWIADTLNHRVQRWLVPNTTVSGYLQPLSAAATDSGFGMGTIAAKLTNEAGVTEVLGQKSQTCAEGSCPISYELNDVDLSEKPSGTYLLSILATDAAANVREASRVISIDSSPPEIELSGSLAESAGLPFNAPSAALEINASDSDPGSVGVKRVNVERDGRLVASYPSDCSSDCHEVEASYAFQAVADGAGRSVKPVANAGNGSIGELKRVSCVAANDCWALGRTKYTFQEQVEQGKVAEPLLERWTGTEWQATTVPKPAGATSVNPESISCTAASSCIAVGSYANGTTQPLVARWNGVSWTASPGSLPAGASQGSMSAVSCGAAADCWAYGKTQLTLTEQFEGKVAASFFSRWNGSTWQTTSVPKPAGATNLTVESISCTAANSCIAVGSYTNGTTQPLVERWNGTSWTASGGSLPAGSNQGSMSAVSCGAAADCWAYGKTQLTFAEQAEGKVAASFFSHWTGNNWMVEMTSKAPDDSPTTVTSISCDSATACTAVGRYTDPHGESLPIAYTRDVAGWRFQPMPIKTEANSSSLESVSCTATNECAMVGYSRVGNAQWQVLAEAETPDGGPHEITVEAIDVQGNAASETLEIDVDPSLAAPPECDTEPQLEPAKGVLTSAQAVTSIKTALPAAVAPTDGATAPSTEEIIDPSYSSPSPNLETVDSLATGETSVTPEGGFNLGDSVCFSPATLTSAATDAAIVNGDAALFANTGPETDTVIRPTAMGATLVHSIRGPNARDTLAWNVTVEPGQELVELPSGGAAVVEVGSEVGEIADVPPTPANSTSGLADVEVQIDGGEYQLINAADETQLEVVAVIAQPWVVLAQGGIVPVAIEVVPDTETPNEFEVWLPLPQTPEEKAVWPAQAIIGTFSRAALNGTCAVAESPCGALDFDQMARYAVYWGNEEHHGARNPFYADYGSNNCTNFISQILRAGGGRFMRAYENGDGSWWYYNIGSGGVLGDGPSSGWEDTESWKQADKLPRHLWRFGLAHIDPVQQPWGWIKGNIIALDWIDTDGKGNVNHLQFVVGTIDPPTGREPVIANSSSKGSNYPHKNWLTVKKRVEEAHGSSWTRFSLAAKHRVANLNAKKHNPANLYTSNGLFSG
ncbi:MAG TPA: amidase domain-containing protein [Solirubrobacterales bacterium]|nr:amidase domain-containing protein [Solirubrobacterales bacterium]